MEYRSIDEGKKEVADAEEEMESIKHQFGEASAEYRDASKKLDEVRRIFFIQDGSRQADA